MSLYKIGTKIVELRVVLILMWMISTQQYAYLPGRAIHHTLLKLDIFKAFDCVEWPFDIKVLQHMGFGEQMVNFFKAIPGNAKSP